MNAPRPFGGGVFIADKSAWMRARHPSIQAEWNQALENDQIATCAIVRLELLWSTRNAEQYAEWDSTLSALRQIRITQGVCNAALTAMRELAEAAPLHHRIPLPDYLIAAAAQENGAVGVLHYDHDFERLHRVLEFEHRWISEPGSVP